MDKRPPQVIVDEIAASIVLADDLSPTVVGQLTSLLAELNLALANAPSARVVADRCQTLLPTLQGPDGLEALSQRITLLHRAVTDLEVEREQLPLASDWEADDDLLQTFISSQRLALEELERGLLAMDQAGAAADSSAIERLLHTSKGEAGIVGVSDYAAVCHAMEDALALGKSNGKLVDQLLKAKDWMLAAVGALSTGEPLPPLDDLIEVLHAPAVVQSDEQLAAERHADQSTPSAPSIAPQPAPQPATAVKVERDEDELALFSEFLQESDDGLSAADELMLEIEANGPSADQVNGLFRVFHTIKGVSSFLELEQITELAHTTETMLNRVREGEIELTGQPLDLVFDATATMRELLEDVRQAVTAGAAIVLTESIDYLLGRITGVSACAPPAEPAESEPEPPQPEPPRLGEILVERGHVAAHLVDEALAEQQQTGKRLGEVLISRGAVTSKQIGRALREQRDGQREPTPRTAQPSTSKGKPGKLRETVKVDLERVDSLVETIGELVIVESMVTHDPDLAQVTSHKLRKHLNQLTKITRDLQSIGLQMRTVPLRGLFQKMSRLVRDLAHKSHKAIRVEISGEGTEMDRSMVEQIADPMLHLIRNAVDHGIEPPHERVAAGKGEMATITLRACHEGSGIVIEVLDDGRGLDREAILRKALSRGIVKDAKLSEAEIHELIFAPGFSTAAAVTEISGRGVGMDVVRRNIDAMRGRIQVKSDAGAGSTFRMVLPLTLAIIDGMIVVCGAERFIVPTLSIVESIQLEPDMLLELAGQRELVKVRGEVLPLLRLGRVLGSPASGSSNGGGPNADGMLPAGIDGGLKEGLIVVVESVGWKAGLLVDDIVTQQQVVIKSLTDGIGSGGLFCGAAILSDGLVGLILNVDGLAEIHDRPFGRRREAGRPTAMNVGWAN